MKTFYRVCNDESKQGLWYKYDGHFLGLIHNRFNFCVNRDLKMEYDPELVGWLSAVETLEELYNWFPDYDIKELQNFGWFIHEYEVDNHRFYDRFQHPVICQKTSKLSKRIILL